MRDEDIELLFLELKDDNINVDITNIDNEIIIDIVFGTITSMKLTLKDSHIDSILTAIDYLKENGLELKKFFIDGNSILFNYANFEPQLRYSKPRILSFVFSKNREVLRKNRIEKYKDFLKNRKKI